jgi:peroxiredoxin
MNPKTQSRSNTPEIKKQSRISQVFAAMAIPAVMFICLNFGLMNRASAQGGESEDAISKFNGERKYDIERPGVLDGVPAPNFQGTTIDGMHVSLSAFKGKVIVLNFWFIACPPCRLEVIPLNEIVQQFKDKEVIFLSVAREKEEDLKTHLKRNEFLFQTVADPSSAIGKDVFHLLGYPTTIVIDKTGKIRYYTLGGKIDEQAVRKEFQQKLVPVINDFLNES